MRGVTAIACTNPIALPGSNMLVPCGKCVNCSVSYSNLWSQRIMDEVAASLCSCMITLTYAENPVNLIKSDLQKFFKRLRARISPVKVRYFACGEYGGKGNRPHYHVILCGWRPPDLIPVSFHAKDQSIYYSSEFVSDVWKLGFVSVGDVTLKSAKYCAKYLTKLDPRHHDVKPFTVMSRKPGIGRAAVTPDLLVTGVRYFDGVSYTVPKYYLDQLEKDGYNVDVLRARNMFIAKTINGKYIDPEDIFARNRSGAIQLDTLRS